MNADEARERAMKKRKSVSQLETEYIRFRQQVIDMKMMRIAQVIKESVEEGNYIAFINFSMYTIGDSYFWGKSMTMLSRLHEEVIASIESRLMVKGYVVSGRVNRDKDNRWANVRW